MVFNSYPLTFFFSASILFNKFYPKEIYSFGGGGAGVGIFDPLLW